MSEKEKPIEGTDQPPEEKAQSLAVDLEQDLSKKDDVSSVSVHVVEDLTELKVEEVVTINPVAWYRDTKAVIKGFRANWLLLFVIPAMILAHIRNEGNTSIDAIIVFIFNMIAIVPLVKVMTICIDDMAARLGQAYTAVLHAFSGNLVELIILGIALNDKRYSIVRSSLLGAVLSNLLLVLGLVFLVASIKTKKRSGTHNIHIHAELFVSTTSSVLVLAVLALVTPATFKIAVSNQGTQNLFVDNGIYCDLQNISHATAIILLILYIAFLVFQLKTHAAELIDMTEAEYTRARFFLLFDLVIVAGSLAGVTFCAKFLVKSIEDIAEKHELGHSFVGMVLLPLGVMSNFMEHYHAVCDAADEKLDTAISLILNTSVQVILLTTPILVLTGWIIGRPLTLDFTTLEIVMLACSVLIVNYLVADCKANWLEGIMLLASFLIIATVFFYYPNSNQDEIASSVVCGNLGRHFNPNSTTTGG